MFYIISFPVWRYCLEISLPDLIVISLEVWADTHASSTGVIVVKKQAVSVNILEAAEGEEAMSSLII